MKCYYHTDLDGQAAAFCVHAWAGIHGPHEHGNCMRPITYGDEFPVSNILPGEQVWIVDYSIDPKDMEALLAVTPHVTWIDHHKTSIDKYEGFPHHLRGIRCSGVAGCVLTWQYLHWYTRRGEGEERFGDLGDPYPYENTDTMPVPRMIELVGDRDIWAWKHGDETKHFFAGSQLHDTSPESDFWWKCMEHETQDAPPPNTGNRDARLRGEKWWAQLLRDGETIERYKAQSDVGVNEAIGYEVDFEGYRCFACNRARVSSDRFGDRIGRYDILLPHYHNGKQWTVSLYSESVDVSDIAKRYGGGGHKGAAGFQCPSLPWMSAPAGASINPKDTP